MHKAVVHESEEIVDQLVQELYQTGKRSFRPVYPWVFVRVLPKEQMTEGGIIMVQNQNKTVHEGIVLATWEPIAVKPLPRKHGDGKDWRASVSTSYRDEPMASELKAGDHVLFQHWAGIPVEGFSDKHYRCVKETAWKNDEDGGIFAVVDYSPASMRAEDQLQGMVDEYELSVLGNSTALVRRILDKFVLVERGGFSVTMSGR